MTTTVGVGGSSPQEERRASIALPSALRPSKVSISNNAQAHVGSRSSAHIQSGTEGATTRSHAVDTNLDDGDETILPTSSPQSATKRLYGSTSSARSHSNNRSTLGASPTGNNTSPSKRGGGPLPSILPSSAFLTPRKPSRTLSQYSTTNSAIGNNRNSGSVPLSPSRSGVSSVYSADTGRSATQTRNLDPLTHAEQQHLEPALYLAAQPIASASASQPLYISDNHQRPSVDTTESSRKAPSSFVQDAQLSTTHGGLRNDPAGTLPTRDINSNSSHERNESQQGTIKSKTSREPLIATNGTDLGDGYVGSRQGGRRKSSKTGSITGLFSLRTPPMANNAHPPNASAHADIPMPPLAESNENVQATRSRTGHPDGSASNAGLGHTTVPILSPKTQKPMRNYQIYRELQRQHKQGSSRRNESYEKSSQNPALAYGRTEYGGNNRFWLSGRLVTSGDSIWPFLASLAVATILPGAFFAFESQWLWDANPNSTTGIGTPGGKAILFLFIYSTLIMWSSMLRTSLRDPGIIVKGLDKEPDWESVAVPVGAEDDLTGTGMGQRPKLRYFRVKDELVSSKWCETCQTYRPPRTSHCRLCDVCTEQTDHHCSFLNNCIGRRNYSSFIAFLISAVVCALFTIGVSLAHLIQSSSQEGTFWEDWHNIGSIVLVVLATGFGIPVLGLLCYHCRLMWISKTTIEVLRPRYPSSADGPGKGKPHNPYAYSRRIDNIIYNLCKPMDLYSAIQPHALAEKDARQEHPAFSR